MPPKRAGEHPSHSRIPEYNTTEKWPKLINVEDEFDKNSPQNLSSAQSTMNRLKDHVKAGSQAAVQQLIEQQRVNLNTHEGGNLLWTAYELNKLEIASMLVRYGADLRVRQCLDDRTILHDMLRSREITNIAMKKLFKLMLDHKADVDAVDTRGYSLLNCAIASPFEGTTELAEELLKHGAQVKMNKDNWQWDDIRLACKHKMMLLPKLVVQHDPDVKTRDRRASIAIKGLICEKYPVPHQATEALLVIKMILDLGVPVDVPPVPDAQSCKPKHSFLDTAFSAKNMLAIQFLLERGANPNLLNVHGQTTFYQATAFNDDSRVSIWLIEKGVSIRARNNLGHYPIHGACINESVLNIHLLVNLGASLRAVDKYGVTPFGTMNMNKKERERQAHHLVIKHLALMVARGEKVCKKDIDKINEIDWSKRYFEDCTMQLALMKEEKVHNDVLYFSLLSKNMYNTIQLVKDQDFVTSFKKGRYTRSSMFSEYVYILMNAFELAEKRLVVLSPKTEELRIVFNGKIPDFIVEKIAYYVCFDELEDCRYRYFINYHANARSDRFRFS